MAVVQTQGTGGGATKPKVPKDVTFVDLERGVQTTQEAGVDLARDIWGIKAYADACFLVFFANVIAAAVYSFIKIPIWPAVGLTSFVACMMFMLALLVMVIRDNYIEKRMSENGRAPN